jgi:chromosome partitioning protein
MHAVSDPSDDLATRGRAIFQRLRGTPSDNAAEPEDPAEPADPGTDPVDSADLGTDPAELADPGTDPVDSALTDEELASFAAPPPADHPEPDPPEARGPLPGAEDLPALDQEALAPPIYVPLDEAPEPALTAPEPPPAPVEAPPVVAEEAAEEPSAFARPLPRVLAVANQKGGVGKTTTAVNLGACLADIGYRVLVVDLDPQGNASTGLGINIRDLQGSMYDVVLHDLPIEDCVEATSVRNLFCAPSSLDLAGAEIELVPAFSRELRLRRALEDVRDDYDFVLIDCPPSLGLLTVNGLAAATEVIVPIQCEYYALEGLGQLLRNVNLVQKNLNPALEVSAIILVMYDARTKLADQVVNEVREHFGPKVCKNVVPRTVRLSEAPSFGQPIIAFDPSSRGAIAYRELAKEVSGGTPQRAG